MKLVNKTSYPTRELRSIMIAVHNAEPRGPLKTWKRLVVEVIYSKRGNRRYTGHAYLNGGKAVLSLPREDRAPLGLVVKEFAALWRHEMWHLYGLRHRDYPPNILWCRHECVSHVDLSRFGETVALVKPTPKLKPTTEDKQRAKVEALLARRKAWLTKHKRATNALAKIERSLRYYEKAGIAEAIVEQPKAASPKRRRRRKS